jgi:hypothetical protein
MRVPVKAFSPFYSPRLLPLTLLAPVFPSPACLPTPGDGYLDTILIVEYKIHFCAALRHEKYDASEERRTILTGPPPDPG